MAHRLEPLLRPRSVAVVGASARTGNLGGNVVHNLRLAGFPGPVYPVHPREREVHGVPALAEVAALPPGVDCAVVAVAAERTPEVLRACLERGVRSFVMLNNGFSEAGTPEGLELDRRVRELLAPSGTPACGPNCMGLVATREGALCYSNHILRRPEPGPVGLVAQSGSVSLGFLDNGRGVRFSYVVSAGNELNVGAAEYLDFLLDDPETRVVACFLEQVRDGPAFAAALRRARKPVVLLKVGRSAGGARQVRSHTGALAGRSAVFDAVCRKYGAIVMDDLDETLVACDLLARGRAPAGPRVATVAGSGGELALVADLAEREGLTPQVLLDIWGKGSFGEAEVEQELARLLAREDVDSLILIHDLGRGNFRGAMYARAAASVYPQSGRKPAVFCSNFVAGLDPEALEVLRAGGVPLIRGMTEAMRVLSRLQTRPARRARAAAPLPLELPPFQANEAEVKALLRRLGIATPRGGLALDEEQASRLAAELGYPVALKLAWPGALHKSDAGGVALGLGSDLEVRRAYHRLTAAAPAAVDGVLVEEMVAGGQEMILSRFSDDTFGPAVMVGAGGVLADLLEDACILIPPFDADEARRAVLGLRSSRLLLGYRGRPALDLDALAEAACTFGRLEAPGLELLEVNPLLVRPAGQGVVALDARLEAKSGSGGA